MSGAEVGSCIVVAGTVTALGVVAIGLIGNRIRHESHRCRCPAVLLAAGLLKTGPGPMGLVSTKWRGAFGLGGQKRVASEAIINFGERC